MTAQAPVVRYVRSADGTSIAASLHGDPRLPPLLSIGPWATARFSSQMGVSMYDTNTLVRGRFVVSFYRRGAGASARDVSEVGLEAQVADVDAVASLIEGPFDLLGMFDGAAVAIAYAARHPQRVRRLALWHPFVDGARWIPAPRVRALIEMARSDWTLALHTMGTIWSPRASRDQQRALARGFRENFTAEIFAAYFEAVLAMNVEDDARNVRAETLVLFPSGAGLTVEHPQQAASLIPNARLQAVEQSVAYINDEAVPAMLLRFFDGDDRAPAPAPASTPAAAHGTAIILFADIADSTALTERMGDTAFRERARALDAALRSIITEAGGSAIEGKLLGDGVLATFPAAAQAIDAALRFEAAAGAETLGLHIGVHAGDVIREADNVYGGAVNIAARISALAAPGEVLVSDIVRGLARTSAGVTFEDRGEHALKGVADPQRVYAVRTERA